MIKIENLYKAFGSKQVLNGVDLEIPDSQTICIIGKSGCGKSVLLKHIVGLLDPDKGRVLVDDLQIDKLNKNQLFDLRRNMGFVFQGAALFDSMSVYENVVIGQYEHGVRDLNLLIDEAQRTLSAVGLLPDYEEKDSANFIKEWNILKVKKPADLSGGMKKRVGVARALVGSPKYIFYDEPTTGLDPVTSEQIDDLIAKLAKKFKVTSIVITHDMFSVFCIADTTIMLDQGKVRFQGVPDELNKSEDPIVIEFLDRYK
jgi:phospholipid/cholesterol/gamma-HCH transport system ATP-binding protein